MINILRAFGWTVSAVAFSIVIWGMIYMIKALVGPVIVVIGALGLLFGIFYRIATLES